MRCVRRWQGMSADERAALREKWSERREQRMFQKTVWAAVLGEVNRKIAGNKKGPFRGLFCRAGSAYSPMPISM